ncbi:hypothetical protein M438DRAFT_353368 [Aureobasidium pullulans EXF-150]|uniref:Zn(2)-C6 fungal-type domain-containing protein n=1 Tax=Aureobasidium pullulans EXF-150 TaxID=1043002 RepID=A0A074XL28_AURPU|nr:uncharacterized protein M438DRAFT_353368 [Aureobasidium pullulans EXF-150]KEQ86215.1 hypothetical protein M438DRAFT_353368 [Aureobasidium pullulans EXF-150]
MSDPDDNVGGSPKVHIGRACDHCRSRKIRCDRATPCANCVAAGIQCKTSKDRPQVQRQRVLISGQYERKIDAMEERLHSVETLLMETNKMLRSLLNKEHTISPSSTLTPDVRDTRASFTVDVNMDRSVNGPYDGETSLMAHSRNARRVIEHLLQSTPSMSSDPEVIDALKTLHAAMQGPSRTEASLLRPGPTDEDQESPRTTLPPQESVFNIIRGAQAADCLFFSIWLPFFTPDEFMHLCDQLYSDFDSCSLATKTTLYGGLHYMFAEYLSACKTPFDSIYWAHAQSFKLLFESCLRRYSVLSIPTFDNVLALVFGAGHAIQVSDYASAWPMVSTAANMCQALGWHRLPDGYARDAEAQRILFWLIYYFDKCLSLRLGRSSNIQDFDISVSYPKDPVESEYRSWHLWFLTLIDIATAHGLIYEQLYSPGSMQQLPKQRSQRVLELEFRLDAIAYKSSSIVESTVYRRQYMIYLVKSNAVVIGCLRTLTYRAASPSEGRAGFDIDPRCLSAARLTLRLHQDAIEHVRDRQDGSANDYANWTILNSPFTPFIVLFCHVIVSFDLDDLKLMEAFTISLESLNLRTARPMLNFRVLCETFLLLATRYIRMSTREMHVRDQVPVFSPDSSHATPSSSGYPTAQGRLNRIDLSQEGGNSGGFNFLPPGIFENWLSGSQDFDQLELVM